MHVPGISGCIFSIINLLQNDSIKCLFREFLKICHNPNKNFNCLAVKCLGDCLNMYSSTCHET